MCQVNIFLLVPQMLQKQKKSLMDLPQVWNTYYEQLTDILLSTFVFCVCTFLLTTVLHLTTSFHQPSSEHTMPLPFSALLSQHTNWSCRLTHWLICLCHAVSVTFDILTQLPKMSANYLHTMHHIPSFTSLFHPCWHKSISLSAVSVLLFQKGYETHRESTKCQNTVVFTCNTQLHWGFLVIIFYAFFYRLQIHQAWKCGGNSGEHDWLIQGLQQWP